VAVIWVYGKLYIIYDTHSGPISGLGFRVYGKLYIIYDTHSGPISGSGGLEWG